MVIQEASRKVKPPLQYSILWVVTVTSTGEVVHGLVSQDRQEKTRRLIEKLSIIEKNEGKRDGMGRERLESRRGFLVYVKRTYQYINPYLNGIYLTLHSWRPHRDRYG